VTIQAHVVQPEAGELLEWSMDGETWTPMEPTDRPFYRAVFEFTMDASELLDGLHQLQVRSTRTGETRVLEVVIANGAEPAALTTGGTLAFNMTAYSNRVPAAPKSAVKIQFNDVVLGEIPPGAVKDFVFDLPAASLRKSNILQFRFDDPKDGMRIGCPVLTIGEQSIFDVRDRAIREIKQAHWGDEAVHWGGYNVGDGLLLETPFVRHQDTFCFVLEDGE
jgi:hypothetical protein